MHSWLPRKHWSPSSRSCSIENQNTQWAAVGNYASSRATVLGRRDNCPEREYSSATRRLLVAVRWA